MGPSFLALLEAEGGTWKASLPLNAHKAISTNSFPGTCHTPSQGHHPEPHLLVPTLLGPTFQRSKGEIGFTMTMAVPNLVTTLSSLIPSSLAHPTPAASFCQGHSCLRTFAWLLPW